MNAWAAEHFPGANPAQVRALASWMRGRVESLTVDVMRDYARRNEQWSGILAGTEVAV